MSPTPPVWLERRNRTLSLLQSSSSSFESAGETLQSAIAADVRSDGATALIEHLSFCGAIPEALEHDSTEEKLFSKYTDVVVAEVFNHLGFRTQVLNQRGGAADVDVHATDFAFVVDAKAFRLSRTAKNQKDFKVESMDKWRRDKHHALIVAPLFQYLDKASQIYEQAARFSVCLLSYAHLRAWLHETAPLDQDGVRSVLNSARENQPSKSAQQYWKRVNGVFRGHSTAWNEALKEEFIKEEEHLDQLVRAEQQTLEKEIAGIRELSHEAALAELLEVRKLPQRLQKVRSAKRNKLFDY